MADTHILQVQEPAITMRSAELRDFFMFLIKLAILMFLVRSFIFAPFNIPSESMLPRLFVGDYLIVSKWPYGFSRYSLPWNLPLIPGRVLMHLPTRGDVVVFKAPPHGDVDFIKRVIGLPGDTVQMRSGQLILNGVAIPKTRIDDLVIAPTAGQPCFSEGGRLCHFPRYRETLPDGRSYDVLDLRDQPSDTTPVYTVPAGKLFLMGDNRDNSEDSRFTIAQGGIGMVPIENLVGRAEFISFSWDAGADVAHKIRWSRIGGHIGAQSGSGQ